MISAIGLLCGVGLVAAAEKPYVIVDTGQTHAYGTGAEVIVPERGGPLDGQDAQYRTNPPRYSDNGDGTVSDLVTGLMWEQRPDFVKRDQDGCEAYAAQLTLAGYDDWRLPTIKELFSIADFDGNVRTRTPYIDTGAFAYTAPVGAEGMGGTPGRRFIDGQYASSTRYLGITMGRDRSSFGFNFADGRIKSYPLRAPRFVRCVRGNPAYGHNDFVDNGDGTVADRATGLTWMQADSAEPMDWPRALAYAEGLIFAGHDDWRLPTVKELQSIVDYGRAPDATDPAKRSPAIDSIFTLRDPESWAWTSTTHLEFEGGAYYVCFGQSFSAGRAINAHGAGAVRSDPKVGDPMRYAAGHGPQKDEVRILNYVRPVRGGGAARVEVKVPAATSPSAPVAGTGAHPFIERFDRNGDGAVSRAEFDGRPRRFQTLDADGDGVVTVAEAGVVTVAEAGAGPGAKAGGAAAKGLELVTVGTCSPLYNPRRSRPCMLIRYAGQTIICDMGEGTAARLEAEVVKPNEIAGVLFTHHHRDHNADAMTVLPTLWQRGRNVPIVRPQGTRDLVVFLRTFYETDLNYRTRRSGNPVAGADELRITELPTEIPEIIPGLRITSTEVPHSITTFAYRFDAGNESVVITGDLTYSADLVALAKGADIMACDSGAIPYSEQPGTPGRQGARPDRDHAAGVRRGRRGHEPAHPSIEEIARMATESGVAKLVLVHFRPGTVDEAATVAAMRATYRGEIIFAEDMQTFTP